MRRNRAASSIAILRLDDAALASASATTPSHPCRVQRKQPPALSKMGASTSDELLGAIEIRTPAFRRSARARGLVRAVAAISMPAERRRRVLSSVSSSELSAVCRRSETSLFDTAGAGGYGRVYLDAADGASGDDAGHDTDAQLTIGEANVCTTSLRAHVAEPTCAVSEQADVGRACGRCECWNYRGLR